MATRKTQNLKNKKILITAGPTWVPIDNVRVISNIATGETGILLAERLQKLGAKVTLLLGPVESCCLNKRIKLIRFKFFDELRNIIKRQLESKQYDILIHSAAVSDYRPKTYYKRKVRSGIKEWKLNLVPTSKIINLARKIDRTLFLVGFKFESEVGKKVLIGKTRGLINRSDLNLAVANTIKYGRYEAYIVKQSKTYGPFLNKNYLIEKLIKVIGENL